VAVGLFVTLLAAILPAVQAGRISPLEALRRRGQPQEVWLMRWGIPVGAALLILSAVVLIWNPFPYDVQYRLGSMVVFLLFIGAMLLVPATTGLWERAARKPFQWIYGSGGQIGARNLERARLRTMLTAAALLVGVSMIVNIQGMTASFASDLRSWMEAYIGGDLYVNSATPLRADLPARLEAIETVQAAAPIRYFDVTWQRQPGMEETINFMAVDPSTYTRVTRFLFSDSSADAAQAVRSLQGGGQIFISSVMAEKYQLQAGDTLWLQTRTGLQPFTAAAVVMDFFNQGMVVTGSWEDMERFFRIDDATFILIKVRQGASVDQTRDRIDSLYGKRYQLSLDSNLALKQRVLLLMDQAFRMFDVLGIIAVVVAALGVVNTLTMSVIERTREIGMLRSIGMTRFQVVKMVLAEAGLLGIIGGLLGVAFGVILTRIFLESMAGMSGYKLTLVIPEQTYWIAITVALVVSQAAAVFPALRAARTPVLEAIHYE
jgi:putative ABC transport system permease protein